MAVVYEKVYLWGEQYPVYAAAKMLGISAHSIHRAIRHTNSSENAIKHAINMDNLHKRIKEHTAEYRIYRAILSRCKDKNVPAYKNYGGRGISVCARWDTKFGFCNFLDDMGPRPDGATVDRIDNNKDYSPENCRWATPKEQARNRRTNRMITLNGSTLPLVEWCEAFGAPYATIYARLARGDSPEKAFRGFRKEAI